MLGPLHYFESSCGPRADTSLTKQLRLFRAAHRKKSNRPQEMLGGLSKLSHSDKQIIKPNHRFMIYDNSHILLVGPVALYMSMGNNPWLDLNRTWCRGVQAIKSSYIWKSVLWTWWTSAYDWVFIWRNSYNNALCNIHTEKSYCSNFKIYILHKCIHIQNVDIHQSWQSVFITSVDPI